jgi:hypothetical protein
MTFHDGEPVTADDAVFTIQKIVEIQPPAMSPGSATSKGPSRSTTRTFDINLKSPTPPSSRPVLTFLFILPEHVWADARATRWMGHRGRQRGDRQRSVQVPHLARERGARARDPCRPLRAPQPMTASAGLRSGQADADPRRDDQRDRRHRDDGAAGGHDERPRRAERPSRVPRGALAFDACSCG